MNSATLHFDLTEGREELMMCLRAGEMSSNLSEIYNLCRSTLKHGSVESMLPHRVEELLEEIKRLASFDV
jgi:hypothetical protein